MMEKVIPYLTIINQDIAIKLYEKIDFDDDMDFETKMQRYKPLKFLNYIQYQNGNIENIRRFYGKYQKQWLERINTLIDTYGLYENENIINLIIAYVNIANQGAIVFNYINAILKGILQRDICDSYEGIKEHLESNLQWKKGISSLIFEPKIDNEYIDKIVEIDKNEVKILENNDFYHIISKNTNDFAKHLMSKNKSIFKKFIFWLGRYKQKLQKLKYDIQNYSIQNLILWLSWTTNKNSFNWTYIDKIVKTFINNGLAYDFRGALEYIKNVVDRKNVATLENVLYKAEKQVVAAFNGQKIETNNIQDFTDEIEYVSRRFGV